MPQAVNILVLLIVYAGVVCLQWWVVERDIPPRGVAGAAARALLSVLHAGIALFFFFGVVMLVNVIVCGRYNRMAFGPYENVVPFGGALFGVLVPWLPVLMRWRDT